MQLLSYASVKNEAKLNVITADSASRALSKDEIWLAT